jgi:hypothetical protein
VFISYFLEYCLFGTNLGRTIVKMTGHDATKRTCGAKLKSRPWDHEGCQRRALEWSQRCVLHAGPKTEAGRAKAIEALSRGRQTAIANRQQKSRLRQKAKSAARKWTRDFGHPASPMAVALFDPNHPTHESVRRHAEQLINTAKAGYDAADPLENSNG